MKLPRRYLDQEHHKRWLRPRKQSSDEIRQRAVHLAAQSGRFLISGDHRKDRRIYGSTSTLWDPRCQARGRRWTLAAFVPLFSDAVECLFAKDWFVARLSRLTLDRRFGVGS